MSIAASFRELNVYKLAREGAKEVFEMTAAFPREELYSLTSQIRRSSRAVNAMIAEAWARRRYEAAFINKINEALGETMETQSWLDQALDDGYIVPAQFTPIDSKYQQVGGMLSRMMARAADFCGDPTNRVAEDEPSFGE